MSIKLYFGKKGENTGGQRVIVRETDESGTIINRYDLPHIVEHSPTGFSWGFGGSGPADLALSILADVLKDEIKARGFYQDFKWSKLARFGYEFEIAEREILDWEQDKITDKIHE